MDDYGHHHENGRQKHPQGQWLMQHQSSMKQIMTIMAERDVAIQERNLAMSKKRQLSLSVTWHSPNET
ncbi:basic pentacysteine6-like protein [Tanacetum coccineum]